MKFKVLVVLALLFLFVGSTKAQTFDVTGNWSFVRDYTSTGESLGLSASSASSFTGQFFVRTNGILTVWCKVMDGIVRSDNSITFTVVCEGGGIDNPGSTMLVAGRPVSDDDVRGTWRHSNGASGKFEMKRQ